MKEKFYLLSSILFITFLSCKDKKANIEAERKANEENQKEAQSNFYRIIEGDLIKHNCIAY